MNYHNKATSFIQRKADLEGFPDLILCAFYSRGHLLRQARFFDDERGEMNNLILCYDNSWKLGDRNNVRITGGDVLWLLPKKYRPLVKLLKELPDA